MKRLHDILEDKLIGRNDKLTYRTLNRSSYAPLLDLRNAADAVTVSVCVRAKHFPLYGPPLDTIVFVM